MHPCQVCDKVFKTRGHLKNHLQCVHNIDTRWYECPFCELKFKHPTTLAQHLSHIHDWGTKWYHCSHCEEKFKQQSILNHHQANKHGINRRTFTCELCANEFKQKQQLQSHLSNKHDIGPFDCQLCYKKCAKRIQWDCERTQTSQMVCRTCFQKATGSRSRVELNMVKAIKADPQLAPFVALTDKRVSHDACETRRRPDLILSSDQRFVIVVECDEHQHSAYEENCEHARMDEIWSEFKSAQVVFVRWNPDSYKSSKTRSRTERLMKLIEFLKKLVKNPPKTILLPVFYLFYSQSNKHVASHPQFKKYILH